MFDVRRSSFKTIPYGMNVTCERLQNNLALMGRAPWHVLCFLYSKAFLLFPGPQAVLCNAISVQTQEVSSGGSHIHKRDR